MKKHRIWPLISLLLILMAILVCLGLVLMYSLYAMDMRSARLTQKADEVCSEYDRACIRAAEKVSEDLLSGEGSETEYESENGPQETPQAVIFVGDSRTVGMRNAMADLPDDCVYVGESGEGYGWFDETGRDLMKDAVKEHPGMPVVMNLGVNDTSSLRDYLNEYRSFSQAFPGTDFYFMSVNPVTEDSVHVTNDEIVTFNNALKAAFPSLYIDTYSWMKKDGFESVDGVHYSEKTYRDIRDYALEWIFKTPEM